MPATVTKRRKKRASSNVIPLFTKDRDTVKQVFEEMNALWDRAFGSWKKPFEHAAGEEWNIKHA